MPIPTTSAPRGKAYGSAFGVGYSRLTRLARYQRQAESDAAGLECHQKIGHCKNIVLPPIFECHEELVLLHLIAQFQIFVAEALTIGLCNADYLVTWAPNSRPSVGA